MSRPDTPTIVAITVELLAILRELDALSRREGRAEIKALSTRFLIARDRVAELPAGEVKAALDYLVEVVDRKGRVIDEVAAEARRVKSSHEREARHRDALEAAGARRPTRKPARVNSQRERNPHQGPAYRDPPVARPYKGPY